MKCPHLNCPHCGTPADEHEASRCLDAWVAEMVMKVKIFDDAHPKEFKPIYLTGPRFYYLPELHHPADGWPPVPEYSIRVADAWEVIKKLNGIGHVVEITNDCVAWSVVFIHLNSLDKEYTSDWRASLPVQICRTAIKAVCERS